MSNFFHVVLAAYQFFLSGNFVKFYFQGLLLAHDRLAFREALPSEEDVQEMEAEREEQQEPQQVTDEVSLVEDDNVKIVRIDKASEPLGATVKNENGTVMIGRIVKGGAADKCGEKELSCLLNLFSELITQSTTESQYVSNSQKKKTYKQTKQNNSCSI